MTIIIKPDSKKSNFCEIKFRKVSHPVRHAFENMVDRTLMPHLSGTEFKVLHYIRDRSLGWNREGFVLRTSELFSGGCRNHNGLGISRKSAFDAINRLEEMGVIYSTMRGVVRFIWVNLSFNGAEFMDESWDAEFKTSEYWEQYYERYGLTPFSNKQDAIAFFLAVDNKQVKELEEKMALKSARNGSQALRRRIREENPDAVLENHQQRRQRTLMPKQSGIEGSCQQALSGQAQQAAKRTRTNARPTSTITLEQAWVTGIRSLYDEDYVITAWGVRERSMVKTFISKLTIPDDELPEFFEFVAGNWTRITNKHYQWVTSAARHNPSLSFLIVKPEGFLAAYNDRESLDLVTRSRRKGVATGRTDKMVKRRNAVAKHKNKQLQYQEMLNDPDNVDYDSAEFKHLPLSQQFEIRTAKTKTSETGFKQTPVRIATEAEIQQATTLVEFPEWN